MSSNLVRNFYNKVLSNYTRNNFSQVRLESYKAAFIKEVGKPLVIETVKKTKKLEKNQVRVQVQYCSVNSNDCTAFKNPSLKVPYVPGYEFSGEVLEIGSEVTPDFVTVGEKVAALSKTKGGFAEECVVDKLDVWRLPGKVTTKSAAVLLYGHTSAMYAFSRLANLKEGMSVIISAGPAGLGLAAIDVAANVYRVKPLGVCDNEDRAELIRKRGAFGTANFSSKKLLKDLNLKRGADIVYDAVGGETHGVMSACAGAQGKIFHAAPVIESTIPTPPANSWWTHINIEYLREKDPLLYRDIVSDTLDLAEQGLINAHVSAKYSLEKINDAITYIENKECTGKVLIKVAD